MNKPYPKSDAVRLAEWVKVGCYQQFTIMMLTVAFFLMTRPMITEFNTRLSVQLVCAFVFGMQIGLLIIRLKRWRAGE